MVSSQRTETTPNGVLELSKIKGRKFSPRKNQTFGGTNLRLELMDGFAKKRPKPKSAEGRVWPGRANGRNVGGVFTPRGHITIENDRESPPQS